MKHEWRKHEKEQYLPKTTPNKITIKKQKYFVIEGIGNPNSLEFKKAIEVLYSVSYTLKMFLKKGNEIEDYFDYTVYPLEGFWDLTLKGREEQNEKNILNKDELVYKLMIRQPDFLNETMALEIIQKTKHHELLNKVKFEIIEEGEVVQILHIGSYNNENESFLKIEQYCLENNLKRLSKTHKEIYLSDARKVASDKLKTVLRISVK